MKAPALISERLYLEPLSKKYLSIDYVNWLNNIDVHRFMEAGGNYTLEMLENYLLEVEQKEIYFWAIIVKNTHKHIGNIKIDPIVLRHGLCEYAIMMGDTDEWGKGYAKEASMTVIDYCFKVLNLRKMTLGVVEKNTAAFHLYRNLGFEEEGLYKNHGFYEGNYCDVIRMALFNKDYKI